MYTEEETLAALDHCISGKGCRRCRFRCKPNLKSCLEGFRDLINIKNAEIEDLKAENDVLSENLYITNKECVRLEKLVGADNG